MGEVEGVEMELCRCILGPDSDFYEVVAEAGDRRVSDMLILQRIETHFTSSFSETTIVPRPVVFEDMLEVPFWMVWGKVEGRNRAVARDGERRLPT